MILDHPGSIKGHNMIYEHVQKKGLGLQDILGKQYVIIKSNGKLAST